MIGGYNNISGIVLTIRSLFPADMKILKGKRKRREMNGEK